MRFRGYRLNVILLTFALAVAGMFALDRAVYQHRIAGPLEQRFRSVEGVAEAGLVKAGGRTDVVLHLAKVEDLREPVTQVEALAREALGASLGEVRVVDARNPRLEEVFYRIHYALFEGLATGRFREMAAAVGQVAEAEGLDDYRVFVDGDRIYVQLVLGDAYLYELIPRAEGVASGAGGGGSRS